MPRFDLQLPFEPMGDQPTAIRELAEGVRRGDKWQTLLGVTGSGKTVTLAAMIAEVNRPTLVMSHNKTLAAQLYGELRQFFPRNAVEYFISYYDYYQPEAYVPATDTFIEKDASINEDIDRLRLRATSALMERRDVIVVASVSAIYGLGDPVGYRELMLTLREAQEVSRREILSGLVRIQYSRNDLDFVRGTFRVRGDVIEILPAYEEQGVRVEMWGDAIERISKIDPMTGATITRLPETSIFPATHYADARTPARGGPARDLRGAGGTAAAPPAGWPAPRGAAPGAAHAIRSRDADRSGVSAPGSKNYSRHLDGRAPGSRPYCLLDYFPDDYVVVVDESHVSIPQIGGMYEGDRSRKTTLVEFGFRLPSALDNRPLSFREWEDLVPRAIFVSATPGEYELRKSGGVVVEQLIRPTGLLDPDVEVRPVRGQVDDLLGEIRRRTERRERVLVTTLTKRMAEDLSEFLAARGVRVRYMHSDIAAIDRVKILRDLRLGTFDVLVGINLLREGLDLPEVSLVAILDADKEGFLRSDRSLVQTIGRAARNLAGKAILYADKVTDSMRRAMEETARRREVQAEYNREHGIEPRSIVKSVREIRFSTAVADAREAQPAVHEREGAYEDLSPEALAETIEKDMRAAAAALDFETAARLRDELFEIRARIGDGKGTRPPGLPISAGDPA